jgi:ABC-type Fe3+/spermidine/putrescine transport system ATPase subunit
MSDLIIEDLQLRLGDHDILKGVSLTVPRGKITALLGPSGSGKTTLLRAVAGLEVPHKGTIRIADKTVFSGSDGIVLLNDGVAEQSGTPSDLYNGPRTLFAAEFLGSNNSLPGTLVENQGVEAAIDVDGHRLTGVLRTDADAGALVTGVIRLERARIADTPGPNRLPMTIAAQMYLGERWEIVFARGNLTLRARATERLRPGNYFVELPPKDLWIF